jgi:hypothetical protein
MAHRLHLEQLENRTVPAVFGYSVASDFDGNLYRIDMETGDTTLIGPVGFESVEGLAFQPGTGILFGVDDNSDQLLTIDLATGAGTLVGDLGVDVADVGLSFDDEGNLFLASEQDQAFYSVDPVTGAATFIGNMGEPVTGLTFKDGILYGLGGFFFQDEQEDGGNNLVQIDRATGVATEIGPLGQIFLDDGGLDFDESGLLWGLKDSGEGDLIFLIDPVTGAGTAMNHTQFGFEGLAITAPAVNGDNPEMPELPELPPQIDPCDVSVEGLGIVEALYIKILCRRADADGLDGYEARLANGETIESIAWEIWNSQEHRELQVTQYFEEHLGRTPDPAELPHLAGHLSELGEQGFLAALFGSPEYQALHPTDSEWMASVYAAALGRAPDDAAQSYLGRLAAGETRADIALEILSSDEALLFFIKGQYEHSLERPAGEAEIGSYIPGFNELRDYRSYALQILSSAEFYDLAV